ncbi:MAG: helix-turn-helix domain-containing protein [Dyella sp.]
MSALPYEDKFKACDLLSLSGVLKVSDLEMVLLGANSPSAAWGTRAGNEAIFLSAEADFAFRGRFALPPEWCLIGFIHHAPEGSWCHGAPLNTDTVFTVLPEGVSEFMFSVGTQVSLVLMPLTWLRRALVMHAAAAAESLVQEMSSFTLTRGLLADRLRGRYELIRKTLMLSSGRAEEALNENTAQALLTDHLLAAHSASPDDRTQCSRGRRTHYQILQRTEHFMRANLRRDIYINEMCNAAGVSERALRYAFEDMLGVSPNRYLSLLRLCTACRSLSLADASRRSVKSVALSCGLWDLSRFADNYRRVFGELPRDTLMRAPPREPGISQA